MGDDKTTRGSLRYGSLDGLRGLAAAVVVVHHCFLVSPELSLAVAGRSNSEPWVWWLTFTPLHLIWAGTEAVYVFFILSGFVLALPFVAGIQGGWLAYYAKRFVRIYLPVWGSLLLALLMAMAVPRTDGPDLSAWLRIHSETANAFADGILINGASALNSPLWSLQWEMLFSIALPIYVFGALRIGVTAWLPGLLGLLSLIAIGTVLSAPAVVYMSMFGIGVLLAVRQEALKSVGGSLSRKKWAVVVSCSMLLLCSRWIFPELPIVICMACIGGALLVFAFIAWPPAVRFGTHRMLQWLGVRSFSLYLVHEPIVVSMGYVSRITNPLLVAVIAIPISLVVCEVFFRVAERPSYRLAGQASRFLDNFARRKTEVKPS